MEGLAVETVARDQNYGCFLLNTAEHMHYFLCLGFITKIILVFYSMCM